MFTTRTRRRPINRNVTRIAYVEPIMRQADDDIVPQHETTTRSHPGYYKFLKSTSRTKIEVPLSECDGFAYYQGKRKKFVVAVLGSNNERPLCLFVNVATGTAYHDRGGFNGNLDAMSEYDGPAF